MKKIIFFVILTLRAVPPIEIPADLYADFTLHGAMDVAHWYRDDSYGAASALIYTREAIDRNMHMIARKEVNYYGQTDIWLYEAIEKYIDYVKGKVVGIIGSTVPWYESIVVYYGGYPVTVEYNKIISQDDRVKVMTVEEYDKDPILFDAIFSISSFEHDGLGRYGDRINPYGDFNAMQKVRTMLKSDGLLFLSVPVGEDRLFWNVHRIYGKVRLPLLINGWEMLDSFGFSDYDFNRHNQGGHQPIFVLRMK